MAFKKKNSPPAPPRPPRVTYGLPNGGGWRGFPRVISVLVLIAVVLLVAALFFRVIASFIVPLFLAAVLVVVFEPLHKWVCERIPGRPNWSAGATTAIIVLVVFLPFGLLGWKAVADIKTHIYDALIVPAIAADDPQGEVDKASFFKQLAANLNFGSMEELDEKIAEKIGFSLHLKKNMDPLISSLAKTGASWGLASLRSLVILIVGLAIMTFALYYFLSDGPAMLKTMMHLSPLEDDQEQQLLEKFAEVSRAVVVATLVSAVIQGILGGIGYYFVLDQGAPLFLLTVLTMLLAIVPFVGATAVWIPVALWVAFLQPHFGPDGARLLDAAGVPLVGKPWVAFFFTLYGLVVVSGVDNIIKPLVLHGQSKLHPLLALLSVLGGVQVLGPIGILVGPMLIAFLQALLGMLRKELDEMEQDEPPALEAPPIHSPS